MIQWDLIRVGRYYVVKDSPYDVLFSGVPFRVIAKSPPFLLVQWVDDGHVDTLDTRIAGLGTVDKQYLARFPRETRSEPDDRTRCVNCGTVVRQTCRNSVWLYLYPECGSLGGEVNV